LADSIRVSLNAASLLRYSKNFTENRHVFLEGEAFFDVVEDKNIPFTVETSAVTTKVLGTSPNINFFYPESIELAFVSGALKLMNGISGKELLLSPGEGSNIVSGTGEMDKFQIDPAEIGQWKQGILRFNNDPFDKVINKLETWYGGDITVIGKFPEKTCTGTFQKNTYLSNVLKVFGHALEFSSNINQNQVTIHTS
jgi:ferric-dicitrate binding protein FerR (iron transport regulator)